MGSRRDRQADARDEAEGGFRLLRHLGGVVDGTTDRELVGAILRVGRVEPLTVFPGGRSWRLCPSYCPLPEYAMMNQSLVCLVD